MIKGIIKIMQQSFFKHPDPKQPKLPVTPFLSGKTLPGFLQIRPIGNCLSFIILEWFRITELHFIICCNVSLKDL